MTLSTFFLVLASLCLSAVAQVLLRMAMLTAAPLISNFGVPDGILRLAGIAPLWAGLLCYAASMIPWLLVLSRLPVSVAYPMVALGYILTALLGWLLLHEKLTSVRWLGIGLICLGVIFISRSNGPVPT